MMTMTADEPPQDALGRLQWDWGSAYQITGAADRWVARRSGNGHTLTASGPDELREMIVENYAEQPVDGDAACGGTGR
jgi:hypothetical protein